MSDAFAIDAVALARDLIRCRSVTPENDGALAVLERTLKPLGFACHRLAFAEPGCAEVQNLLAVIGEGGPHFCFAGHTDVVPPGDLAGWTVDPFDGVVIDGWIYGRGANDMKGAIAAMAAAVARHLKSRAGRPRGRISLLITGDEEGPAVNGTRKVLEWMGARGLRPDATLVGEPTNPRRLGEMVKIGRRGSLNGRIVMHGVQGHAAYPQFADNPLHPLVRIFAELIAERLDEGTAHFQPSSFQITSIDTGNEAPNVIPAQASAAFNIRFNDRHTAAGLEAWLRRRLAEAGTRFTLDLTVSGECFLTHPGPFTSLVAEAVRSVTGLTPELSTSGGTSDARFIKSYSKVAEFGLVGETMHKVDERASIADIEALTEIYRRILDAWFEAPC
ncbi:MAG: succinyl-diaminopimelate desuccinylase [Rhodospirillales bacterium]|nr:succinyl-diaminopimelate desuccinylase [Rhodospirillales bacterium]